MCLAYELIFSLLLIGESANILIKWQTHFSNENSRCDYNCEQNNRDYQFNHYENVHGNVTMFSLTKTRGSVYAQHVMVSIILDNKHNF